MIVYFGCNDVHLSALDFGYINNGIKKNLQPIQLLSDIICDFRCNVFILLNFTENKMHLVYWNSRGTMMNYMTFNTKKHLDE